jgi:uncharacterized protein
MSRRRAAFLGWDSPTNSEPCDKEKRRGTAFIPTKLAAFFSGATCVEASRQRRISLGEGSARGPWSGMGAAMDPWDRILGHAYTLGPFVARKIFRIPAPQTEHMRFSFADPKVGPIELTGQLLSQNSRSLLIVTHGLGGNVTSGYMSATLADAASIDADLLLLNLRGADGRGHDFNHAGLVQDIEGALAHERFRAVERIYLLGYSLGGHLALSYATQNPDPRLVRVAAISAPLDLSIAADAFDRPKFSVYRQHVMGALHQIYTCSYQRYPHGVVPYEARRIERIREWDEKVIAPRYGFNGAEHYYREVSVGRRLGDLRVPALYVGALSDPMVPPEAAVGSAAELTSLWTQRGGHLGFPQNLDLGLPGPLGLVPQVFRWLSSGDPAPP